MTLDPDITLLVLVVANKRWEAELLVGVTLAILLPELQDLHALEKLLA